LSLNKIYDYFYTIFHTFKSYSRCPWWKKKKSIVIFGQTCSNKKRNFHIKWMFRKGTKLHKKHIFATYVVNCSLKILKYNSKCNILDSYSLVLSKILDCELKLHDILNKPNLDVIQIWFWIYKSFKTTHFTTLFKLVERDIFVSIQQLCPQKKNRFYGCKSIIIPLPF